MMTTVKKFKATILRPNEEEEVLNEVIEKAKSGQSITRQDIVEKVMKFIESDKRKNPFKNRKPGDKWFSLFRKRHNDHFRSLNPAQLKNVENIGFTEKVTNTTGTNIKDSSGIGRHDDGTAMNTPKSQCDVISVKRNPVGRPKLKKSPITKQLPSSQTQVQKPSLQLSVEVPKIQTPIEKPSQETPVELPKSQVPVEVLQHHSSSPLNDDSHLDSAMETDDGDGKSQGSQAVTPDFQIGSRLEARDFNDKWYPVKVMEVDYEEGEVLVHYEKWSNSYNEWVRMERIRQPILQQIPTSKKLFEKNEKVIAVWAYNHKYPAIVKEVLPNDKYEVLFCDGYAKILRGCKLFKATEEDLKSCQLPSPKKPAPPMGADPLDPDLGPKEERRLKKRRMDVLEAYRPHKRQKINSSLGSSPKPSTSTPYILSKETPKIVLNIKRRGRPPTKHKERMRQEENDEEDSSSERPSIPAVDTSQSEPEVKQKRQRRKKKPFDESTYFYRGPKPRAGFEEDKERWNIEIPKGASPVQIKDQEGYYRESVIIPDKKMPPGWTKHTMRRKSGAKWDVFLVNPEGRKFRSRNELRNYFAELKQPFPEDSFDFMVGRKLEMIRTQGDGKRKLDSSTVDWDGQSQTEKKAREATPESRRIKTLLPKGRPLEGEEGKMELPPGSPTTSSTTTPPFSLAELRTPDGGFTCCGKNFRKENLFQMHMKHYHPEYSTLFGSTPNVADLAYARTVGGPLEDSRAEAMTPRNTLLERVTKYEAERKASETAAVSTELNSLPEKESTPIIPLVTEPPVVEIIEKDEPSDASPINEFESGDSTIGEEPEEDKTVKEVVEETSAQTEESSPPVEDEKPDLLPKDSDNITSKKTPSAMALQPNSPVTAALSIPIIRSAPKQSTATLKATVLTEPTTQLLSTYKASSSLQKAPSSPSLKAPITITRYVPPGQKPVASGLTKMTISMTNPPLDKDVKPTIKTLLPMRPPIQEVKETQEAPKPKEVRPNEESEEETANKSKTKKRSVSEPFLKKPKLVKPPTGSLEEEPIEGEEAQPSHTTANKCYRFSRNRSQLPRVSLEKLTIPPDSNGECAMSNKSLPNVEMSAQDVVYENLRKEEIINCTCGYMEEDGLMIQCDLCLCWQHGLCNSIDKESDVPEKYVCNICQNPLQERPSMRHSHNQDWLKEGKLPSLSIYSKNNDTRVQREAMLKKSHDVFASLLEIKTAIHSLRVKSYIAMKPDHPKLYLWAKSWLNENTEDDTGSKEDSSKQGGSGPQPEAAIDETECRLRLLEHIEDYQHQVDDRLTSIEAQVAALESEDPDLASDETSDRCPVTKQTLQMILHDLQTLEMVASISKQT